MRYRPSWLNERATNNIILSDDDMIKATSHRKKIEPPPISQVQCLTTRYDPKQERFFKEPVDRDFQARRPFGILPNLGGINSPSDKHSPQLNSNRKHKTSSECLSLPVISQVACLTGIEEQAKERKSWRNNIKRDDSEFVKLSKAGGQRDLLSHKDPVPFLHRAREHKIETNRPNMASIILPETLEGDDRWVPSKWGAFYHDTRLRSKPL